MAGYTFVTINNIKYFQSKDIKVFPCAYRGFKDRNNGILYNPESRGFTEYNFSHVYNRISKENGSYLISWEGTTLKCVIGGYYFEIYGVEPADLADKELAIRVESINLNTQENNANSEVDKTYVLKSFKTDNAQYLDTIDSNSGNEGFTGLAILDPGHTETGLYASLKLVKTLQKQANDENATYEVLQANKRLDDILTTGAGNYSIQTANTCEANGNNSIALGDNAKVFGNNSLAIGKDVIAGSSRTLTTESSCTQKVTAGDYTVVLGVDSKANASNTVVIGTGLEAGSNTFTLNNNDLYEKNESGICQVVLGKYNNPDVNSAFIFGWGESVGNKKNIFTISPEGNIKNTGSTETLGSLTINGGTVDIKKAAGNSNTVTNKLNLGSTGSKDGGELNIYGTGAGGNPVFKVTNAGATTMASSLTVGGVATIAGNTEIGGTLQTKGTITADSSGDNTLTLGNSSTGYGAINVYGDVNGQRKVFSVSEEGTTTIEGATTINNNLTCTYYFVQDTETQHNTADKYKGFWVKSSTLSDGASDDEYTLVTDDNYEYVDTSADIFNKVEASINCAGDIKVSDKITLSKDGSITSPYLELTENSDIGTVCLVKTDAAVFDGSVSTAGDLTVASSLNAASIEANAAVKSNRLIIEAPSDGKYDANTPADIKALIIKKLTNELFTVKTNGNIESSGSLTIHEDGDTHSHIVLVNDRTANQDINIKVADQSFDDYYSGHWNNNSALSIDRGFHATGFISCKAASQGGNSGLIISDSSGKGVAYIDHAGAAWFAQKLELGKNNAGTGEAQDEIFFRVQKAGDNPAEANLAGNFTMSGVLNVAKDTQLSGKLTVGSSSNAVGLKVFGDTTIEGKVTASTFNSLSDIRIKQNIKPFSPTGSILNLEVKEFEYKYDNKHEKHIGCIAQELQEICPELVHNDLQGYLNIEEGKLVYLLLEEVKKLRKEVDELKGE